MKDKMFNMVIGSVQLGIITLNEEVTAFTSKWQFAWKPNTFEVYVLNQIYWTYMTDIFYRMRKKSINAYNANK